MFLQDPTNLLINKVNIICHFWTFHVIASLMKGRYIVTVTYKPIRTINIRCRTPPFYTGIKPLRGKMFCFSFTLNLVDYRYYDTSNWYPLKFWINKFIFGCPEYIGHIHTHTHKSVHIEMSVGIYQLVSSVCYLQTAVPPHSAYQPAASSVHYTTSCKHSLVLLRMGEIFARNMLSYLELLINRYYCI